MKTVINLVCVLVLNGAAVASATANGGQFCIDIASDGDVYVICYPGDPIEWFEGVEGFDIFISP